MKSDDGRRVVLNSDFETALGDVNRALREEQLQVSQPAAEPERDGTTMRVSDIMTRDVVSCRKEDSVGAAARSMLQGRFGTLPVLDAEGRLAGIITDRDIAVAAATRERNASHIAVHEAMTSEVRSCLADDDVATALRKLEEARVRRLPVLQDERLVGIISVDDIVLRALDRPGGITSEKLGRGLRQICSRPAPEPAVDFTDTFVSG